MGIGKNIEETGLGSALKQYVKDCGLTLKEVSQKSGIPYGSLTNLIGKDPDNMSIKTLNKLALAFEVLPSQLLQKLEADMYHVEFKDYMDCLTPEELDLVKKYLKLSASKRSKVLKMTDTFISLLDEKDE